MQDLEPLAEKWRVFGFAVTEVDGHNIDDLRHVLAHLPRHPEKLTAIICHTVKGKGISFVEKNLNWHHKSRVTEEIQSLLNVLEAD